jgi:hypothetical protein
MGEGRRNVGAAAVAAVGQLGVFDLYRAVVNVKLA